MRRGWGRAGSLWAPPESIQDTGSLQQPVALCMLCRLDSIACRQPSLAWVPSKIKNWTHLRQTDSQITLSCMTWRTDVFLLYRTAQMGHVFLQSGSQVNAWHMELPACLSQGEAKGKVQTPRACQQVRGCRNQPGVLHQDNLLQGQAGTHQAQFLQRGNGCRAANIQPPVSKWSSRSSETPHLLQ